MVLLSSDLSVEDLDTKGVRNKKKGMMPTKAAPNPSQWSDEDIDIVCQYRYQMDIDSRHTSPTTWTLPTYR